MTASSDDSVLVCVKEEEHEIVKKKSMEAWEKQIEDREEHYAGIRRSRGVSFGKNAGKVIIPLKIKKGEIKLNIFVDRGWVSLSD